jgi:hypothetical protein
VRRFFHIAILVWTLVLVPAARVAIHHMPHSEPPPPTSGAELNQILATLGDANAELRKHPLFEPNKPLLVLKERRFPVSPLAHGFRFP